MTARAGSGDFVLMSGSVRITAAISGLLALSVVLVACDRAPRNGPTVPFYPPGTVADDGFRPTQDGLPFENYGASLPDGVPASNMTAADVEKMFGAVVCADAGVRRCDLIPEAADWLATTNEAMADGHCYGFSVLAELLWQGKLTPATLGAPAVTGLEISNNRALQRQIAYDWALQTLGSVQSKRVTGTPNKVLLTLISSLKPGASQAYTLLFWKRDGTGGHAVTPYAVVSRGGGRFSVMVYDNNWPGQARAVSFDTTTNTWSYDASTNPEATSSQYEGDAKTETIALDPTSPGLGTQPCPFCEKVPKKASGSSLGGATTENVSLLGAAPRHANLVVSDDAGHKLGYISGKFVDQIHDASDAPVIFDQDWTDRAEPEFNLPVDKKYTFTLDGTDLTSPDDETISVVGPAFDLTVKNITIKPGEKDTLVVDPYATRLSYRTSRPESPTMDIGISDARADYSFELAGVSDRPGSTVNLSLPAEGSVLNVQTVGSAVKSSIGLKMTREDAQGVEVFQHQAMELAAGDTAGFRFGQWSGAGQPMPVTIVHRGVRSPMALADQPAT